MKGKVVYVISGYDTTVGVWDPEVFENREDAEYRYEEYLKDPDFEDAHFRLHEVCIE